MIFLPERRLGTLSEKPDGLLSCRAVFNEAWIRVFIKPMYIEGSSIILGSQDKLKSTNSRIYFH